MVDFVSDQRAPTPSAGAELITPDFDELRGTLDDLKLSLTDAMYTRIEEARRGLASQKRALRHLSPRVRLQNSRQRLDDLHTRLVTTMQRRTLLARERLSWTAAGAEFSEPGKYPGARLRDCLACRRW